MGTTRRRNQPHARDTNSPPPGAGILTTPAPRWAARVFVCGQPDPDLSPTARPQPDLSTRPLVIGWDRELVRRRHTDWPQILGLYDALDP